MRFGLIDLLIAIFAIATGAFIGDTVSPHVPAFIRPAARVVGGVVVYLVVVYPIYRGFKFFPLVLPRCPCCRKFQHGFRILRAVWPRVLFQCPSCNGEFVIWHNGRPGRQETWDKPVLALKWPYALGRYKRMEKPEQEAELYR